MEYPYRRGFSPLIAVLIVLGAIVLILVVWWVVAAQSPQTTVVVPNGGQTTGPTTQPQQPQPPAVQPQPQPQTAPPQPSVKPVIVQREKPVNIYIERDKTQPKVVIVPKGQQPPEAQQRYQQVNLPDQFQLNGKLFQPSGDSVTADTAKLKDTGMTVNGYLLYVDQNAQSPYTTIYLETTPGSGIYITYTIQG